MKTGVVQEVQDLTYLSWDKIRSSSGTAGSFLKAYSELEGEKIYYKLSNYDAFHGIIGHECVNEKCLTYLCASKDYKESGDSKIALDAYFQAERFAGETPLDFCVRNGWESYIYEMLIVDFLILNRDRHGANMEVLRNKKKRTLKLAPLFDHGLSLIFNCHDEKAMHEFDVMIDRPVQCFVGSKSTKNNLQLIPADKIPELNKLHEKDRESLFADLGLVMPEIWQDKIWEMIWKRWQYYESFCNQR